MAKKKGSRILAEMMEAAEGMYASGIISKKRLLEMRGVCTESEPELSPERIVGIRKAAHLSQAALGSLMLVGPSAIQKWERGEKKPSGPSVRLLQLIEQKGAGVLIELAAS